MGSVLANKEVVDGLVKRAEIEKNASIKKITGSYSGGQPYGFAEKQLYNARRNKPISTQKLRAIAQRFSDLLEETITLKDLILAEEPLDEGSNKDEKSTRETVINQQNGNVASGDGAIAGVVAGSVRNSVSFL